VVLISCRTLVDFVLAFDNRERERGCFHTGEPHFDSHDLYLQVDFSIEVKLETRRRVIITTRILKPRAMAGNA